MKRSKPTTHARSAAISGPAKLEKPPYRVPSLSETADLPWNGFKVASTFSGCGGSCLGYRMAGFKVVWANEFVPIAQESYKANAASDCILDGRSIKQVTADEILTAIGMEAGELDLFDGSPPCQAFSTAGKRHKGWGKNKDYEHGAKQKNEELVWDYLRLLEGLRPKTFVMENVSGMIKGTVKGIFIEVMRAMKAHGYRTSCRLLNARWLGVPQARQRVIFEGVRSDIGLPPAFPDPLPSLYSVRESIADLVDVIGFANKGPLSKGFRWKSADTAPSGTVGASGASLSDTAGLGAGCWFKTIDGNVRKASIAELKRLGGFPDDFELKGTYAQQWERIGNSVPPVMMFHIASAIRDGVLRKI